MTLLGWDGFGLASFNNGGMVCVTSRLIPLNILTIDELNLPPLIGKLAMEPREMVLVTGTSGSRNRQPWQP